MFSLRSLFHTHPYRFLHAGSSGRRRFAPAGGDRRHINTHIYTRRIRHFLLTASLAAAGVFGLMLAGGFFVPGVIAAAAAAVSFLLTCVVDLSIRNGHRNVERILESLRKADH